MRELSNYPPGVSDSTPGAPWNEPDAPEHDTKTITGRLPSGDTESITFCTVCHRTEFCDDWDDPCPVEPEEPEGPDWDRIRKERLEEPGLVGGDD